MQLLHRVHQRSVLECTLPAYAKLLNVSIDYLLRPESDENGEKDDVLNKEILRLLEKFSTDDKEKFVKVLRILCK